MSSAITQMASQIEKAIEFNFPRHFFDLPTDADAYFSTNLGTQPKRDLEQPPPAPIVRSNIEAEIKRKAEQLRSQFPGPSRSIKTPTDWSYLYHYFDAQDLWLEGAAFLYYVLNHMSNENIRMDNDDRIKRINEEEQHNERQIYQWASEWVHCNIQRIEHIPIGARILETFTKGEMDHFGILGMSRREMDMLNHALGLHHKKRMEEITAPVAARKQIVHPQMAHPVMVSPVFHHIPPQPTQHMHHHQPQHVIHHAKHISPPQYAQHAQMVAQQGMARGTMPTHGEHYRGPMVPVQSVSPPQSYQQFMTNQRHLIDGNAMGRQEHNGDRWQYRPRGHSNESAYGRGGNWQSSDQVVGRKGFSNDVRKWEPSFEKRSVENQGYDASNFSKQTYQNKQNNRQSWQKSNEGIPANAPFLNHPSARVNHKSSTFFYADHALARVIKSQTENKEYYSTRTLYVTGAAQTDFVTHEIYDIFSQHGTVDAISYLYPGENNGAAFIMYAEQSSLDTAINCLNDFVMQNGRTLRVKLPEKNVRSRSGSLNSQAYSSHYQNNYNNRGHGSRHQSMSQQPYNNNRRYIPSSTASSPEGSFDNQLTDGFKAQISPPSLALQVVPVNNTNLNSMDGTSQQPLGTISSYSNVAKKGNNELSHEKPRSGEKENTPMISHIETPISSPRKESSSQQSGSKPKAKNNRKGSKQNTSTRPTPAITPIKSRSELNLNDALPRPELDLNTLKRVFEAIEVPITHTNQSSSSTPTQPPKEDLSDTLRSMLLGEITTQTKELSLTVEPSKGEQTVSQTSESSTIEPPKAQEGPELQVSGSKKKSRIINKPKNKHRNPEKTDTKQTPSPAPSNKANSIAGSSDSTPKAKGNNKQQRRQAKHTQKSSTGSNNSMRKTDTQAIKADNGSSTPTPNYKPESKENGIKLNKPEFKDHNDIKPSKPDPKDTSDNKSQKLESQENGDIKPTKFDNGNSTPTRTTKSASKESLNSGRTTPKETNHGSTPTKQISHGNITPPRSNKSASKDKDEASPPAMDNNSTDWPALAPAKSPVMDGKRPAALITRSTKIVPVIPLSMERRRQS